MSWNERQVTNAYPLTYPKKIHLRRFLHLHEDSWDEASSVSVQISWVLVYSVRFCVYSLFDFFLSAWLYSDTHVCSWIHPPIHIVRSVAHSIMNENLWKRNEQCVVCTSLRKERNTPNKNHSQTKKEKSFFFEIKRKNTYFIYIFL